MAGVCIAAVLWKEQHKLQSFLERRSFEMQWQQRSEVLAFA